jgi:hypothetical protein
MTRPKKEAVLFMFRKVGGFKKLLGESVETMICRLEGDVIDPAVSKYLMIW